MEGANYDQRQGRGKESTALPGKAWAGWKATENVSGYASKGAGRSGLASWPIAATIVEKKKEQFEDYAEQMKALVQRYIPPDRDAI